jgi:hypothetical protein
VAELPEFEHSFAARLGLNLGLEAESPAGVTTMSFEQSKDQDGQNEVKIKAREI